MPAGGGAVNGSIALNDNDWVATSTYLWEPTGGGTVTNLENQITAAGYPVTSMNTRCAINNEGMVALTGNESSVAYAFLYDPVANTVTSLNSATINLPAGFVLSSACGINDAGQVTGYGLNSAAKSACSC